MNFTGTPALPQAGRLFQLSHLSQTGSQATFKSSEAAATGTLDRNDARWLWGGYVFILLFLVFRLGYQAFSHIELSEDEAYQWLWSKHPALSYYSKPPMIAYTQYLGTAIWGDTEFGVRFFSPVMAALVMSLMLRLLAREASARAGFWLVVILSVTPIMAVGATLMTVDPLSVLFWTASMICGWRAVQKDSFRSWCWAGIWLGFGFLSKQAALFQLLSWAVFLALYPPARLQLRRAGPYVALVIAALFSLPVLVWNQQHQWITVTHLAERGGLNHSWKPTLHYFNDFVILEWALLHPIFSVAMIWAAIAWWRSEKRNPFLLYLFSMGAPVFIFYFLYTFRARVQPNWIATSVVPLFALMAVYFEQRWPGRRVWTGLLVAGLVLGGVAEVVMQAPGMVTTLTGKPLPPKINPLRRLSGWDEAARIVGEERQKLLAENQPVFLISDHYGFTSLLTFYLPEAKQGVPDHPLAYVLTSKTPEDQFYFWPGYAGRKGENALFVSESLQPQTQPPPDILVQEFASVTDLGRREVRHNGQVYHYLQIFACRNLR